MQAACSRAHTLQSMLGYLFGRLEVFCSRAIMSGRLELLQTLTGTSRRLVRRILRYDDTC